MKHILRDDIHPFLHEQIIGTVNSLELKREEAALLLEIEPRTFSYFKAGVTTCSAPTLLLYLTKMCPDPMQFINEAKIIVEKAEANL